MALVMRRPLTQVPFVLPRYRDRSGARTRRILLRAGRPRNYDRAVRDRLQAVPLRRCPACRQSFARFALSNAEIGERRACPRCGSRQRHRMLAIYLERHTDLLDRAQDVLHVAPEAGLRERLRTLHGGRYVTTDIEPGRADIAADIAALPFTDDSFDVVLCLHVLEHVADDRAALRELRRVLRPSGWSIVQVPVLRAATIEDPQERDPGERLRRFGQDDHVRVYGADFFDRLREAGLNPDVVDMRPELSRWGRWRLGLGYRHPEIRDLPAAWQVHVAR
jgi:SAM-dependent methyltransferase